MKLLLLACFLTLVGYLAAALPPPIIYPVHGRGCYYIIGRCIKECEEGTHSYATGCGRVTPEPTCDEPNPIQSDYDICDYSDCYCDEPTVRDKSTGKCVKLEECPKKQEGPSDVKTNY